MTDHPAAGPAWLPGDLPIRDRLHRMVRVNHAGEYGAVRIYQGQLAILGRTASAPALRHMLEQEREHLARFETELTRRRVRPTALHPLWHLAGFALGAGTALLGEKAAMACTVAVEEVIDQHYAEQADDLASMGPAEADLRATVEEFRADELEHRDHAQAAGAEEAPGYLLLTAIIKTGSRAAIWLSQRL